MGQSRSFFLGPLLRNIIVKSVPKTPTEEVSINNLVSPSVAHFLKESTRHSRSLRKLKFVLGILYSVLILLVLVSRQAVSLHRLCPYDASLFVVSFAAPSADSTHRPTWQVFSDIFLMG
jgi:hypothetical protein